MRNNFLNKILLVAAIISTAGCTKWKEHNESLDPKAVKTLMQQISENTDLSKFASLLTKSGYDKEISGSKTYTVYAPTNAALTGMDASIEADSTRLRQFVSNHIALQAYYAASVTTEKRIPVINGKYHTVLGKKIDDANITVADQYARNGVLQVVDNMLPYLSNSWNFIETNPLMPALHKSFLLNGYYKVLDLTNAVQTGVDTLGRPVYAPGTDSITTNILWRTVYDIRDESKLFTTFVLTDAAWTAESMRLLPYYTDSLRRSFANNNMIQEYAIEGAYSAAQLPDTIVSRYNVKLGIDKNAIVQTIKTSNGYVHIMNKMTVRLQDKFKPIIVEAENFSFSSANRSANTYKRDMLDSSTGRRFTDLVVYNHGLALFNYGYRIGNVTGKQKYRAYWVAVNNNINGITVPFTQKLGIDTATSVKYFGYTTVPLNSYKEQLIGEFTLPEYRQNMTIYLTAANTTTAATNALVCDYIKLEPAF